MAAEEVVVVGAVSSAVFSFDCFNWILRFLPIAFNQRCSACSHRFYAQLHALKQGPAPPPIHLRILWFQGSSPGPVEMSGRLRRRRRRRGRGWGWGRGTVPLRVLLTDRWLGVATWNESESFSFGWNANFIFAVEEGVGLNVGVYFQNHRLFQKTRRLPSAAVPSDFVRRSRKISDCHQSHTREDHCAIKTTSRRQTPTLNPTGLHRPGYGATAILTWIPFYSRCFSGFLENLVVSLIERCSRLIMNGVAAILENILQKNSTNRIYSRSPLYESG